MGFIESVVKNGVKGAGGVAFGVGVVIVAPIALLGMATVTISLARGGISLYKKASGAVGKIVAEARSELAESRTVRGTASK